MTTRVLITGNTFRAECLCRLEGAGFDVEIQREHLEESDLIRALIDKEAYILGGVEYVSAKVLESTHHLRVIGVLGVGYESFVDVHAATRKGIIVTNTPNANALATAEMTFGFMLAIMRRIPRLNTLTKSGMWQNDIVTKTLGGATLGVVGMGATGSLVAKIAHHGFGMRVLYCNRSQKVDVETAASAERSTLADLLKRSDIVSLHLPIIPETTGMIGAAELATMKPDAFLINAARPMLVEPHALATALRAKTIAGCAMDGYYIEPVPDRSKDPFGLLALDDEVFIVSPHVAYLTQRSILKMCQMATDSVIRILNNEPWEHIVNSECRPNR